jgi:hypothetical protein
LPGQCRSAQQYFDLLTAYPSDNASFAYPELIGLLDRFVRLNRFYRRPERRR